MLSSSEMQNVYVDLYQTMRNYIWSFDVIEQLADLEVEVYRAFPDMLAVRSKFEKLKGLIQEQCRADEDLNAVVETFSETIQSDDALYAKLHQVNEVIIQ